jgi:RNA-binding protein
MDNLKPTPAEKAYLRGLGQHLDASVKVGKGGLTPGLFTEIRRQIAARELVKVRFPGIGRIERATLCLQIVGEIPCACVGAVGSTALFYRRKQRPTAPEGLSRPVPRIKRS